MDTIVDDLADVVGRAAGRAGVEVPSPGGDEGGGLSTLVRPDVTIEPSDPDLEEDEGNVAHIVKVKRGEDAQAKVLEARITGTLIEALCGHIWVPARDPRQLPVCPKCKEMYDLYRRFNGKLPETPSD